MNRRGYVYILSNKKNGTLYVGVTNNILRRKGEHKNGINEGFTKKYGIKKLMYYEEFSDIYFAICREKQLKGGSRQKKILLIESINKEREDLYDELI